MISRIGKYTVEAELGRGGFGQVYKAWDPDVRQSVAIKVLLAEGDSELLKRFQLEVVTTASLHHKNIVTIYASGDEAGTPYLVMELLEGKTLSQIIKQRVPLSLMEKVRIMTQVAEGLAYANSRGVVHRDVKPANIMLLPDGQVKIMDFGIALATNRMTATVTMDGYVVGTVPYMAPEQFTSDGKANEQTDIFAFGDVYYELLTGKHPFEGPMRDMNALRMAILNYEPEPLTRVLTGCPEALELLVQRTMAKEREFRYQNFEEVRFDSAAVLVDLQQEEATSMLREIPALISAGELQQARAKVREVQKLEPGNRQARQLLESIDQKLQQKVNRDRVAARLSAAGQQMAERHFAEAVQNLEAANRIEPANTVIQSRLADAKSKLENWVQANRLVEDARARQQKGELAEALERLTRATALDPDHTEATRLIARVRELLQRREQDQVRSQAVQTASEHFAAKRFTEALASLEHLDKLQLADVAVRELRSRIELERGEDERRVRAERFNLAVTRTRETMESGELERARQMLAHLTSNFANEPGSSEVLPRLQERLQSLLRASESAGTRKMPAHRPEAVTAVLKRAGSLRDSGDLRGALAAIADGRRRLGDHPALTELAREIESEVERKRYASGLRDLIDDINELIASGRHAEAIVRISRAREYKDEPQVISLLNTARSASGGEGQKSPADAIAEAAGLRAAGDWSKAVSVLESAAARHPQHAGLADALQRLRAEADAERRSAAVQRHRASILLAVQDGEWKKAEAGLRKARSEFPGEAAFDDLAARVETGLHDQELTEAESRVKAKLAANNLSEAMAQLEATGTGFSRDPRWKALEEEVARRRAYEAGLAEAERQRREGHLSEAETVLTGLLAFAPDARATQTLRMVQGQRAEAEAVAERVREHLQRYNIRQATAELETARAKYPEETGWTTLQVEIDARQAALRQQSSIAESVRDSLRRGDVREAETRLADGRSRHQNDALWGNLQAEIDAAGQSRGRQAEIDQIAERVRESFQREDFAGAATELDRAQAKFPDEKRWAALREQAELGRTAQLRKTDVEAAAEGVRECLRHKDVREAATKLRAARKSYPGERLWMELQREIDACQASLSQRSQIVSLIQSVRERIQREELVRAAAELVAARAKYPDESSWTTLQAEIDARYEQLGRKDDLARIADNIRTCLAREDTRQATAELAAARTKFPNEAIWATLQAEIEERRGELRSQFQKIAETVRASLARDDTRQAAAELTLARSRFPKEEIWSTLQMELDARQAELDRQAHITAISETVRERLRIGDASQEEVAAIAESVRECIRRNDLQLAAAELGGARIKYPNESIWALLKTELELKRALLTRQEHVRAIAERVRVRLKRGALRQAAAELASGRAQYPDEELWDTLQAELDAV